MSDKPLFNFIFEPVGGSKVLMQLGTDNNEPPTISVMSETYKKAITKILKLKLPNVNSEEDIRWTKVEEYLPEEIEEDTDEENHLII